MIKSFGWNDETDDLADEIPSCEGTSRKKQESQIGDGNDCGDMLRAQNGDRHTQLICRSAEILKTRRGTGKW